MLVLTTAYLYFIVLGLLSRLGQCEDADSDNSVSCDFHKDICGWQSPESVDTDQLISVCRKGNRKSCFLGKVFQTDPWIRQYIKYIPLMRLGFPFHIAKKFRKIDNGFAIRTANTRKYPHFDIEYNVNDAFSMEIPYSMKHRCLRYKHFVRGNESALVVGYITDYSKPFDLSHILKTHGNSPVIRLSSSAVTLPVGVQFKVVFRAVFVRKNYGLALISSVSIDSGICDICDRNEYRCSDERDECIPLHKVCDLKPDCLLGEDEKFCASDIKKSQCSKNDISSDDNKSEIKDADKEGRFIPHWHSCATEDECSLNYTDSCSFYCPPHCTCSGLSLNCSATHDIPKFITSITLHSLVRENITFDDEFRNLRKIEITSCKSCYDLYIQIRNDVREIIINNSEFKNIRITAAVTFTVPLYRLSIQNSFFGNMPFPLGRFDINEWAVQNSTLNSTNKTYLWLSGNRIDFSQTQGLKNIRGSFNFLVVNFSSCSLTQLPNLIASITLDLSHNKLKRCSILYFTHILYLQDNRIEHVNISIVGTRQHLDPSYNNLQHLDLSYNQISVVGTDSLNDFTNLLHLKLNKNRIISIHKDGFSKLNKLIHLDLSNNKLYYLIRDHFIRLTSLQYLNIQDNNLNVVEGMFDGLISIQYILVDDFTLCCAQPKAKGKVQCLAPVNDISSCDHLIDTPFLGIVIWYIALLAVFGNFCGTLYRYIIAKREPFSSFVLYSINLGVADFLMGVYLYIIAGANITFSGRYGFADEWWRNSPICTFAGVLATLSSESSALFVLLITIDRIHVIRSPFSKLKTNGRIPKFLSGLVWTLALMLSVLPLLENDYFHDYYSVSGICISLPLSVQRKSGWEYSMTVFVGSNFLIFLGILIGQIVIFINVVNAGKRLQAGQSMRRRKEASLAKLLIAVAVTDLLCWIPIGAIGLLTFVGVDVTSKVYAWVVVVVLPINSALNPLIYTFSAIIKQAHGGCDRSAEDAYSSMAPDPAFAFVEGPCCPTLDFVNPNAKECQKKIKEVTKKPDTSECPHCGKDIMNLEFHAF